MTTKTYNLIETDQNGDQLEVKSYGTRFEAVQAMATRLMADDTTQPQNFRIEEAEQVDEEAVVMETANKVVKLLPIYGDKFEIKSLFMGGSGFVEIHYADQKYPSLSRYQLERLFNVIDEVNAELPEGYEAFANINHECAIRIMLSTPKKGENK